MWRSVFVAIAMAFVMTVPVDDAQASSRFNLFESVFGGGFSGSGSYRGVREIDFDENHPAGTVIVDTSDRKLYLVLGDGRARAYGVGVGRQGFTWSGRTRISRKAEWPGWTPPAAMRRRQPELPAYMPGGPNNPLGARALYLGSSLYRIHGTNQAQTIGMAMSSGCIRMLNSEVIDLYNRVRVGTRVIVRH